MTDRLSEIRARLEKATPGPWSVHTIGDGNYDNIVHKISDEKTGWGDDIIADIDADKPEAKGNADFIAHARADLEWAVLEIERLRNALALQDEVIREVNPILTIEDLDEMEKLGKE